MAYTDDIVITSTHTSTSAAKKYIQPYLHKLFAWTKQNNLTLNPDKTTCSLFTPDPAEYKRNMDLKKQKHCTAHGNETKGSGPYLRPKTHIQHTHSQHLSTSTQDTTNDKKTLIATGWGKHNETLMVTYKAGMIHIQVPRPYGRLLHTRPALTNCKSCRMQH